MFGLDPNIQVNNRAYLFDLDSPVKPENDKEGSQVQAWQYRETRITWGRENVGDFVNSVNAQQFVELAEYCRPAGYCAESPGDRP